MFPKRKLVRITRALIVVILIRLAAHTVLNLFPNTLPREIFSNVKNISNANVIRNTTSEITSLKDTNEKYVNVDQDKKPLSAKKLPHGDGNKQVDRFEDMVIHPPRNPEVRDDIDGYGKIFISMRSPPG
ncbi:hypothetical protein ACF0H5_018318 [Mactra antiquata]